MSRLRENCFPKHDIQNDGDASECKTLLFRDVRMLADVVEPNIMFTGNGSNICIAENAILIVMSRLNDRTIVTGVIVFYYLCSIEIHAFLSYKYKINIYSYIIYKN